MYCISRIVTAVVVVVYILGVRVYSCTAVHLRYCHFKLSIEYTQAPAENNSNKGCAALTALQCTYASDSTALASALSLYFFSNFIKVKPRSPVALGI